MHRDPAADPAIDLDRDRQGRGVVHVAPRKTPGRDLAAVLVDRKRTAPTMIRLVNDCRFDPFSCCAMFNFLFRNSFISFFFVRFCKHDLIAIELLRLGCVFVKHFV